MKSSGIVRHIDELGRIVVPKEMRKKLGISACDPVEISSDGEKIYITKYSPVCHFCGSTENISEFKEKNICQKCIDELAKM